MRLLTSVFLLCLFLSIPISTNASTPERRQSLLQFSSFEITATNFKQYKSNAVINIQLNHSTYRATLAEIFAYQFLSLAFVMSLFYLNTNQ
jgi:hypothetical protein